MKLLFTAILGASLLLVFQTRAQSLIEAKSTAEAAAVIRAADTGRADLIGDAIGLGVADPVELIFALITEIFVCRIFSPAEKLSL